MGDATPQNTMNQLGSTVLSAEADEKTTGVDEEHFVGPLEWRTLDGRSGTECATTIRELQDAISTKLNWPLLPALCKAKVPPGGTGCACLLAVRVPPCSRQHFDSFDPEVRAASPACSLCRTNLSELCLRCTLPSGADECPDVRETSCTEHQWGKCDVAVGSCGCGPYHSHCLENWFARQQGFTCPTCMKAWIPRSEPASAATDAEPVDVIDVSYVTLEGSPRSIKIPVTEGMRLTPLSLKALISTSETSSNQLEGLVLRQLGQKDLKLAPNSALQLFGKDRFVFCHMLSSCARHDVCVKVQLPSRTVSMDLHSHQTIAGVCREIQSREGVLAGRLRLSLGSPGKSTGSDVGASLSPTTHLCELSIGQPSILLNGDILQGNPPLVDLDFFGQHGMRLPSVNLDSHIRTAWPSLSSTSGAIVYVSVRSAFSTFAEPTSSARQADISANVQELFTASEAWMPWPETQTDEGIGCLLAVLHVVSAHCTADDALRMTRVFRSLMPHFPPSANALRLLLGRRSRHISAAEKAVAAAGIVTAIKKLVGGSAMVEEKRLFEVGARLLFYILLREGLKQDAQPDAGWACLGMDSLPNPDEARASYKDLFELLVRRSDDSVASAANEPVGPTFVPWQMLLRQFQKSEGFGDGPNARWSGLLRVLSPLALARAPKPSLTRDEAGHACVFTGTGKDVSRSTQLFLPTRGEEITVDVHHVAQKLKRLGDLGDTAMAEASRPTQEAIMVLLDTSNSMDGTSGFKRIVDPEFVRLDNARKEGWDDTEPENDTSDRFQQVLEQFRNRPNLAQLREFCQRSADACRIPNSFAKAAAAEMKALEIMQELCRLERLKLSAHPDVCRIYTKHKESFVKLLCAGPTNDLTGAWAIEIVGSSVRSGFGKSKKKKRFVLPGGEYQLQMQQSGTRLIGDGKDWKVKGSVEGNEASFILIKDSTPIATCKCLVSDDGRCLQDGNWEGEAVGAGTFTGRRTDTLSDASSTAAPPDLLCPITQQLMTDPVTCADGHSYEREALEHWVHALGHRTSPLTGAHIRQISSSIVPNHALRKQIDLWMLAHPEAATSQLSGAAAAPARKNAETFQVFCKTLTGQTTILEPTKYTAISELKILIQTKCGIPEGQQRLIFAGKQLEDAFTCEEYGISKDSTIHLILRLGNSQQGGQTIGESSTCSLPVLVTVKHHQRSVMALMVKPHETLEGLMFRIWCAAPPEVSDSMRPSNTTLWSGMKSVGDGYMAGTPLLHSALDKKVQMMKLEPVARADALYYRGKLELTACDRHIPSHERRDLTRLECVKQLFHAFVNRSQAYDYPHEIGLTLFGDTVEVVCPISPVFEDFRETVDTAATEGDTKLYDAVEVASEQLQTWKRRKQQSLPDDVSLRVLVLSDGTDTSSESCAWEVARGLQRASITVDTITIGGEPDKNLHAIAKATGGYVFQPESLANALRLNELEVLLASSERPPKPARPQVTSASVLHQFKAYQVDKCDENQVPAGRVMPLLSLRARGLTDMLTRADAEGEVAPAEEAPAEVERTPSQRRRAMAELRQFHTAAHPAIEVFPSDDIFFWKVLLEGPEGTPYQNGLWVLYIHLPKAYPDAPPTIRFVTPIRHCNVNAYGRVCHSILDRNYTSETSVLSITHCIFGLLLNPDYEDPLDSTLALEFYEGSGLYEDSIRRHVARHAAGRTREDLRQRLMEGESAEKLMLGTQQAHHDHSVSSNLQVGDLVAMRDSEEHAWVSGFVTSLNPLQAMPRHWRDSHTWAEVRPLTVEEQSEYDLANDEEGDSEEDSEDSEDEEDEETEEDEEE